MRETSQHRRENAFLSLVETVQRQAEPRLERLLSERARAARRHGREVELLVLAVRDLVLRGGKRLRPALVAAGLRAASGRARIERAVELGLSLEMLHSYLLIHDDWMDGDALRRGGPTVHKLLAKTLRSSESGDKSAILAGDYAMGVALELLAEASERTERRLDMLAAFAAMHNDAIFGQQLDVTASSPDPEHVYALKTASYTVQGPLRLGALLGGAKPALLALIDRFSLPAGVAFQLRDDLLGAFGQPKATGKPRGADLGAGKYTLLVKLALERAKPSERRALEQVLGNPRAKAKEIEHALGILERTGARDAVEERVSALSRKARRTLSSPAITAQGRELFEGALRAFAERPS